MNGGCHQLVKGDMVMAFSPTPIQRERYEQLLLRFFTGARLRGESPALLQDLAVLVIHEEHWPSDMWSGATDGAAQAAPLRKALAEYWTGRGLEPSLLHSDDEPNSALWARADHAALVRILYQSLPEHDPDGFIPVEQALRPQCTRNDALAALAERVADRHGLRVRWPILYEAFQLAYVSQRYATSRAVDEAAGRGAKALLQRDKLVDLLVKEGALRLGAPKGIGSWEGWYFRDTASHLDEMVAAFK